MSSDQSVLISHMNGKFYTCSKFSDVVFYITLRIDMYGSTVHYDTLQLLTLHYVTRGWKTGIRSVTASTMYGLGLS